MGYKTLKDCTSHIQPSSIFCSGLTNNSSLCFYTIFDFNCFLLGLYTFLIVVLNTAYSESTETSSVCNFFSNTHLQHSLFVQLYSQEKDHGIKTHESFPDMSRHISTTEREQYLFFFFKNSQVSEIYRINYARKVIKSGKKIYPRLYPVGWGFQPEI